MKPAGEMDTSITPGATKARWGTRTFDSAVQMLPRFRKLWCQGKVRQGPLMHGILLEWDSDSGTQADTHASTRDSIQENRDSIS